MAHLCSPVCVAIITEQAKGLACPPVWNSLSHEEQRAWLAQEHSWNVTKVLHRAVRAAKVLFGAALVAFCWIVPPDGWHDCTGAPEPDAVTFVHAVGRTVIVGQRVCSDTDTSMCPIYDTAFATEIVTLSECADVPAPGVGEVIYLRTTIIDGGGNTDEQCGAAPAASRMSPLGGMDGRPIGA